MRAETCNTCASYNDVKDGQGECRNRPPVIVVVKVRTFEGLADHPASAFPSVHNKAWCAKWTNSVKLVVKQ